MKKKKNFAKQFLSLLMAVIVCTSGISLPVRAEEVIPDEEAVAGEILEENNPVEEQSDMPESNVAQGEEANTVAESPTVYFENSKGERQEITEGGSIALSPLDEGQFVVEGIGDKEAEWNFYSEIIDHQNLYHNQWWINAYSGDWQPFVIMPDPVEGHVFNSANPSEVFMNFSIETVSSGIDEIKVYHGEKEVTADKPYHANGNEAFQVTVKGHIKDTDTWVDVPYQALECSSPNGTGYFAPDHTFELWAETAQFTIVLAETRDDAQPVKADFTATSANIELEDFNVSVPSVWYIDKWQDAMGSGGSYTGIMPGSDVSKNIVYSFTPENTLDTDVKWEALTPDIAEYTDVFSMGIVPKKAGLAKFKVTSTVKPELSKEVQVEFKYKNPLTSAAAEKDTYVLEKGKSESLKINVMPEAATEQRFIWTYDKEGIVKVSDSIEIEHDVSAPTKFTHSIEALKAGIVKVTGTPYDETSGCKPVTFTVKVTENGVVLGENNFLEMAKADIAHGVEYLKTQNMIGYNNDEWNVFTVLRSGGKIDQSVLDSYYANVVEKLKKGTNKLRATDIARVSITLAAMGKDLTDIEGINLMEALYTDALSTKISKDTTNAPIWALIALDCQNAKIPEDAVWTREKLIDQIIKFQTADGGIALFGTSPDLDITGMAVQAMAPYQDTNPKAKAAVDKAIAYMKNQITDKAGFVGWGSENSCSTAQVVTALTAAGIDPTSKEFTQGENNPITNLDSYKTEKGFLYKLPSAAGAGAMSTQQVTYALESYRRFAENENRLYDLTDMFNGGDAGDKEDKAAAEEVIKKIEAIGEVTLDKENLITEARKAYDALSEKAKALVTNKNVLEEAEKVLEDLKKPARDLQAVFSIERFTLGQGYFVEPIFVNFKEGDNVSSIIKQVIGKENFQGQDNYLEAIKGADLGADEVAIPEYITKDVGGPSTEEAKEYGNDDEWLGEFDYSSMSGWMYAVNNVFPGYGIADYQPKDGDVIRLQFTYWGYGADLGTGMMGGTPANASNKDEITRLMARVNADEVLKEKPAVKEAYAKAVDLVSKVITPQEEIDAAAKELETILNNGGNYADVTEVERLISEIGEVTLESLGKIEAAEAAYNKLPDNRKALVSNYKALTDARAAYDKLKEEADKEEADRAAAAGVTKQIEAIGEVTLDKEAAVKAARAAYDGLTEAQKGYVSAETLKLLTDAEERIEALKAEADRAAAEEVEKLISDIGEVTLESAGKIEAAEKAYAALTEAQKALVKNYKTLTDARAVYDKLKEEADKEEADRAAAAGVTKQIEAIGEVTLDKEAAVKAARAAYDGLTEAQKGYVSAETLKLLTDAEERIEALKAEADRAAAEEVEKLISDIGEVTLESAGKIEAAEKAYAALTEAQKALVKNYKTLTDARAAYDKLKEEEDNKNEGGKTITNSKYKVSVSGEEITSDMVLEITPLTKDDADVKAMQKAVSSKYVITKLYHMAVYKDGKEVTLNKDVKISWTMDEKYNGKTVTVLHVINGKVEKLTGKVENGMLTVTVKALGNFGVVLEAKDNAGTGNGGTNGGNGNTGGTVVGGLDGVKTGDDTPIVLMWAAMFGAAALGTAVAVKRKKQKQSH